MPFGAMAQSATFFQGSVFEGLEEARSQNKMLIVEFYAEWSRMSRWMHEVLGKVEGIEDSFVVVSVDTKSDQGVVLAQQYRVTKYPALVVFRGNGDAIEKIERSMSVEDFSAKLGEILLAQNREAMWQLQEIYRFASQGSYSETEREKLDEMTAKYLKTQDREHLMALSHWELFSSPVITYYRGSSFDFLVENVSDFFDPEVAKRQVARTIYDMLVPMLSGEQLEIPYELLAAVEGDSIVRNYVEGLSELCDLVRCRAERDAVRYVYLLERVLLRMPPSYEYQLVMSLDFVPSLLGINDKESRSKARKMVEGLIDSNLSATKMSLTMSLLDKF